VRPRYRLQALLDLRTRAEDEARAALARAVAALEVESRRADVLEQALARRREERHEQGLAFLAEVTALGGTTAAFRQRSDFEGRLLAEERRAALDLVHQAQVVVPAAREQLERAQATLTDAARERRALERHREVWRRGVRRDRQRREELAEDEAGGAVHLARAREKLLDLLADGT
jgi:flagellar biosynthesis chaperone FliJ